MIYLKESEEHAKKEVKRVRIAIVDDIKAEAELIKELLARWSGESAVSLDISCFAGGEVFLDAFSKNRFDVVFMDIYMNCITGTKTAKLMREKDSRVVLIFLTSSAEHTREAFACHAFEYIEKPADYDRIFSVMSDVMKIMPSEEKYIEFTCSRQTTRLLYSNFAATVSLDHYLEITDCSGQVYKTRSKFSDFAEPLMKDGRFLKINKGLLVNMDFVISFDGNICVMPNNLHLPVKVRDRAQIEKQWLDYNFGKIRTGQKNGRI